jgi:Zn-dependent peptidase ImmA (M78 family)/DNA-binding XRE family transcriptional regulator
VAERVEALVEPELLVWARKKAGFDVDVAARKASVSPRNLAAWEKGEGRPSVKSLRRLAKAYGRSLAVFYLPEPPPDFTPINDYRRPPRGRAETPSAELVNEVEEAHERREVAIDLLEESGELPLQFSSRATLDENPESVASRLRLTLGIDSDEQFEWGDSRAAFNGWRFAVESLGVLVSQMTTVDRDEARGFSIAERPFPLVAANNRDPLVARSFTVLHELTHVALHASGLCDLNDTARVERFCNHVAGAALVPAAELVREDVVAQHGDRREWTDAELVRLARRYRVSREVVLRRLLILGRTDEAFYAAKREELLAEYAVRAEEQRRSKARFGPLPSTVAVIRGGRLYARLVLTSYSRGAITARDVAAFLGVRMKHVPSVERAVFGAQE